MPFAYSFDIFKNMLWIQSENPIKSIKLKQSDSIYFFSAAVILSAASMSQKFSGISINTVAKMSQKFSGININTVAKMFQNFSGIEICRRQDVSEILWNRYQKNNKF